MSDARLAADLLHDVAKYVARTARNAPALDGELLAMLREDLRRAGEAFARLAPRLARSRPDPRLDEVRALFAEAEDAPPERARAIALAVEQRVRAIAGAP